mmetsp:Transcript_38538/g.60936  ORF Transcript_38538/g.60936 Transcript_38538/m.60936 type:complete len:210 (-) Transcript_38538:917-1546(-)
MISVEQAMPWHLFSAEALVAELRPLQRCYPFLLLPLSVPQMQTAHQSAIFHRQFSGRLRKYHSRNRRPQTLHPRTLAPQAAARGCHWEELVIPSRCQIYLTFRQQWIECPTEILRQTAKCLRPHFGLQRKCHSQHQKSRSWAFASFVRQRPLHLRILPTSQQACEYQTLNRCQTQILHLQHVLLRRRCLTRQRILPLTRKFHQRPSWRH